MRADARLRDWPDMTRYREANRTLAAPAAGEARVVFMGDSITDGWQQPRYGGFFPGKPYVDRGISGQTTPQMLLRFRRDVVDLQPKAVVILAGTNDIAGNTGVMTNEEIQGNLATMSELAHAHKIKVVMSSGRSLERKAASNAPIKVGSGLEPQRSRGTPSIQTRPFSRRTRSRDCCASKCSTRRGQLAKPYSRASTNCASCRRSGVTTPNEGRTAGPSRVEGCASGPSHTDTRASASAFPSRCCFCSVFAWLRRFSSDARGGKAPAALAPG